MFKDKILRFIVNIQKNLNFVTEYSTSLTGNPSKKKKFCTN